MEVCPLNKSHLVKIHDLLPHIHKCKEKFPGVQQVTCSCHALVPLANYFTHIMVCSDRLATGQETKVENMKVEETSKSKNKKKSKKRTTVEDDFLYPSIPVDTNTKTTTKKEGNTNSKKEKNKKAVKPEPSKKKSKKVQFATEESTSWLDDCEPKDQEKKEPAKKIKILKRNAPDLLFVPQYLKSANKQENASIEGEKVEDASPATSKKHCDDGTKIVDSLNSISVQSNNSEEKIGKLVETEMPSMSDFPQRLPSIEEVSEISIDVISTREVQHQKIDTDPVDLYENIDVQCTGENGTAISSVKEAVVASLSGTSLDESERASNLKDDAPEISPATDMETAIIADLKDVNLQECVSSSSKEKVGLDENANELLYLDNKLEYQNMCIDENNNENVKNMKTIEEVVDCTQTLSNSLIISKDCEPKYNPTDEVFDNRYYLDKQIVVDYALENVNKLLLDTESKDEAAVDRICTANVAKEATMHCSSASNITDSNISSIASKFQLSDILETNVGGLVADPPIRTFQREIVPTERGTSLYQTPEEHGSMANKLPERMSNLPDLMSSIPENNSNKFEVLPGGFAPLSNLNPYDMDMMLPVKDHSFLPPEEQFYHDHGDGKCLQEFNDMMNAGGVVKLEDGCIYMPSAPIRLPLKPEAVSNCRALMQPMQSVKAKEKHQLEKSLVRNYKTLERIMLGSRMAVMADVQKLRLEIHAAEAQYEELVNLYLDY